MSAHPSISIAFDSNYPPYISHPMVIVTRDDVGFIDGLNGLKDKTIAIEQSYASFDILSKDHPELKLVPFSNSLSAMQAVSTGEVFSYIGNVATLSHMVREHGITNIKVSGQAPYSFSLSIGVRDDWPELTSIIQKTLDSISVEKRNQILQKWIAVKIDKPFNYTLLWQASAVVAIVILMIIYWNLALNKKVSERTAELEFHAHFDTVTHLPNRVLIHDRLQKLIESNQRKKTKAAVLFLDLDDFKKVNDSLGHDTGDLLLIEIAKRINTIIRSIDTVGRLGGDEFILLIEDLSNDQDIATVTNKILKCFQDPFIINDRELILTISIGIAIFPDNGTTTSELLRNSDIAMYNAKKEGKNTYSFFTQSMSQRVARQLLLEEHMHTAMAAQEFEAFFQPKVALDTKELIGFEALLRWNSKTLGSISPIEFIPIAENNGQIIQLGDFVLEEAIKACKAWQDQFEKPFVISVNLSPRQFRDREVAHKISMLLDKYQLPHNCLELEITEGVLINEYTDAKKTLKDLYSLGIQLAMDDFGTGYSSLSYLRNYPFNILKIDREFINDITSNESDKTLAFATIAMAKGLGLEVVAEGVETKEQFELLAALKCDYAQGYLISKPIPRGDASRFIASYLE